MTRRELLAALPASAAGLQLRPSPWYRHTLRWGQTNITERDPEHYDVSFWRAHWKRTRLQGVIINAGGIVAYYPSRFPLHHRAQFLNGRDLFGELTGAAHSDGLAVLARMDSNRAAEDFYQAHPEWFCRNSAGEPLRAGDKYIACIHSGYYDEYLPQVIREIIGRSRPEGFTDNSWAGLSRSTICYCENCRKAFLKQKGRALPARADWDEAGYRDWILWSYSRRTAIWEQNNRVTQAAGGRDCLWVGMNSGSVSGQARTFRDYREILSRSEIVMLDHQARHAGGGFEDNSAVGKLVHGVAGWGTLIAESMAQYQTGPGYYRAAAKPAVEARLWMLEGFAGGIQPWWHHVGAALEDRRALDTAEPVMRWHEENQAVLINRRPVATVGLVWSQRNTDFYGRDAAEERTEQPYNGWVRALVRARIPWIPVHVADIEREAPGLAVLILPNLAAMSDEQCATVRKFAQGGGTVIATGVTSLFTELGDRRGDFGLADLFGVHAARDYTETGASRHTYLRIEAAEHPVLAGFEKTAILGFGGALADLKVDAGTRMLLTFIPPYPAYPPETAWMRTPKTNIPGMTVRGRVLFLPADVDRRYSRDLLPDHARLLANAVRWAAGDRIPLHVDGPGLLDCNLYEQTARMILHLVNLTATGGPNVDEAIPVGPARVRVRAPGFSGVRLLVSGVSPAVRRDGEWLEFVVERISLHECAELS